MIISLDNASSVPIYRQIFDEFKEAIITGRLAAGQKLPSTRELAKALRISRLTVMKGYEELASANYITLNSGSHSIVVPGHVQGAGSAAEAATQLNQLTVSGFGQRVMQLWQSGAMNSELHAELNFGAPDFANLPDKRWKEMLYAASKEIQTDATYENDPFGYYPLREALADYVRRQRKVNCTAAQVMIFGTTIAVRDFCVRILVNEGDLCLVEEPGFPGAAQTLIANGARVIRTPVDAAGMSVASIPDHDGAIKFIYANPSRSEPVGITMSMARRKELLAFASAHKAVILEDDFDNEFFYGKTALPSIQGLDREGRVIFISSFWKGLYPMLRLAFAVIPESLQAVAMSARSILERDYPVLEQRALARFIAEGHLERHIKRIAQIYAARRAALIQQLTMRFGKRLLLVPDAGGTHIMLRFGPEFDSSLIDSVILKGSLPLVSTAPYYHANIPANEYLMAFGHLTIEEIEKAVEVLAQVLLP